MWLILGKYGVPEIDLVRFFHVDMQTERFISKSGCAMRVMKLIKVDWAYSVTVRILEYKNNH